LRLFEWIESIALIAIRQTIVASNVARFGEIQCAAQDAPGAPGAPDAPRLLPRQRHRNHPMIASSISPAPPSTGSRQPSNAVNMNARVPASSAKPAKDGRW